MTRVLYIGNLNPTSRTYSRYCCLKNILEDKRSLSIIGINSRLVHGTYVDGFFRPSFLQRCCIKAGLQLPQISFAYLTLQAINALGKNSLIFVEKLDYIPLLVFFLAKKRNHSIIFFSEDAMFYRNNFSLNLFIFLKLIDTVYTTKRFEVAKYKNVGCQDVQLVYKTFPSAWVVRYRSIAESSGKVRFVGHFEPDRFAVLQKLSALGYEIEIAGDGYPKTHQTGGITFVGSLHGDELIEFSRTALVNLCFLRGAVGDLHTDRSIFLPASRSPVVFEYSEDHLDLFSEHFVFSNLEGLAMLIERFRDDRFRFMGCNFCFERISGLTHENFFETLLRRG